MYHSPEENKPQYGRVLIIGEPGIGKTLLASTLEETLILDVEGRAAHAQRERFTFTKDRKGLRELESVLKGLASLKPQEDGTLLYTTPGGKKIPVRAVQLDSLDELQLNIDLSITSKGFDYWRDMLNIIRGIVTTGRMINAHFICVAHTRENASEIKGTIPKIELALQGQAGQQVPRWFDLILNIIMNPFSQQVEILTQPTVIGEKLYMAKDALHLFEGKKIPLKFKNGRPDQSTMNIILAATTGGEIKGLGLTGKEELIGRVEKDISNATSKPVLAEDFTKICAKKGWDLKGEAKKLLTEKFGEGYDPNRGQEYIDFLNAHYGE